MNFHPVTLFARRLRFIVLHIFFSEERRKGRITKRGCPSVPFLPLNDEDDEVDTTTREKETK